MNTADPTRGIRRRRFLGGMGVVGLGPLAGCATEAPAESTTSPSPTPGPPTRTTSRPTATREPVDLTELEPPRRFDFWAGEWAVSDATGRQLGTAVVRTHSGGNLLFEHWSGAAGRASASMTYYDFAAEQWVQARVDDVGESVVVEGGYRDGAMRLNGRYTLTDGTVRRARRLYTLNSDGTVHERVEESTDGGETWRGAADRVFERRGDAGPESAPTASRLGNASVDPSTLPPRRQFDFWVGTWDVHRPPGTVIVRNVIETQLDGHLVVEHWRGAGLVGKSMNYWDPADEVWVKRWVPDNGNKVVMTGGFRDGAMRLAGTLAYGSGRSVGHRASFTPNDDGTVTQRIQLSRDGGETWSRPWEAVYFRDEG